jgi:hypothetical protein
VKFSVFAAALILAAVRGYAETVTVALTSGKPAEIVIDSAVDDRNFQDPRGYNHHGAATRVFARRLTLTNTGAVPITGRLLLANGQDWSRAAALPASFGAPKEPRMFMPRLFSFWCDHISHADSDAPGGKEPLALLNFWSYALCGDTTSALTRLAAGYGIPARKIPLNGHVAAEYFYDNAWHVFDADQNLTYLKLDNHTLASAADLRADPLLARRTKVFGRYAAMNPTTSAFNTSLHEFINPKDEKPVSHKVPPAPVRDATLFPGEQMIVHRSQAPAQAVGRTDLSRWGTVREDVLCLVEYAINVGARQGARPGETTFASGYPILRAVNHSTGEVFAGPAAQPIFEIKVKFHAPSDRISIYCQSAKTSAPFVQKGRNEFLLAADNPKGTAQLVVEWEPAPASLTGPAITAELVDTSPKFRVPSLATADLLWSQISAEPEFAFVPSNFDNVAAATDQITLDSLTVTFLNPNQAYYFRVKARNNGVWGEWSAPLEFRVEKPARPTPAQVSISENRLRLAWPDAGVGCEYLIFGSNRLDFLPEPFAAEEIVAMRNQGVEQSRPNKNLVATVIKPEIELEPAFRFYRVITRRDGILSVPGDLITTPPALTAKLPPALILQDRWHRAADPRHPGSETDEHIATEIPLR